MRVDPLRGSGKNGTFVDEDFLSTPGDEEYQYVYMDTGRTSRRVAIFEDGLTEHLEETGTDMVSMLRR